MGGSDAPFLYPSPERRPVAYPYSNFNPRAATQASYQALRDQNRLRAKPDGPLLKFDEPSTGGDSYMNVSGNNVSYTSKAFDDVQTRKRAGATENGTPINFNQHPDSWTFVAGQSVSYTPMPANTKTKVIAIRWTQFGLRIIGGISAAGILACMICLRDMPHVFGWIMRVAPAWDILVSLYAIYHLRRPATALPPGSTISYHSFAVLIDLALMPFYIYTSIVTQKEYMLMGSGASTWSSLFEGTNSTTDLLFAMFIANAVVAAFHLASAILGVWLIALFRKIAELPPDVNPLEDNLTSRALRTNKHKYKNSEVTLSGDDSWMEKKEAFYSGSTLNLNGTALGSTASRNADEVDARSIPFNHSRVKSNNAFSPHNPKTALLAQQHFEEVQLYKQSDSARNSKIGLDSPSRMLDAQLSRHAGPSYPNEEIPMPPPFRDRSSPPKPSPTVSREDVTESTRRGSPAPPQPAPLPAAAQSQQKGNRPTDNWWVFDDNASTVTSSTADHPYSSHGAVEQYGSRTPQPLKMNPPTPPLSGEGFPDPEDDTPGFSAVQRQPLAARNDHGNGEGERKLTFQIDEDSEEDSAWDTNVRGGTPNRKYYGDLAAATRGVLGMSKHKSAAGANRMISTETTNSTGTLDAATMDSTGMCAIGSYGYVRAPSRHHDKKDRKGRVVSRTGVDIVETEENVSARGFGMRGRREVSGKVAEEGRGGGWWSKRMY